MTRIMVMVENQLDSHRNNYIASMPVPQQVLINSGL